MGEEEKNKFNQDINELRYGMQATQDFKRGNIFGAIKNGMRANAAKRRKRRKRRIILISIGLLIPIIIATSYYGIVETMKAELINLFVSVGTAPKTQLGNIWKKFFKGEDGEEEYWVDIETPSKFIIDSDTGENLAYYNEKGELVMANRTKMAELVREKWPDDLKKTVATISDEERQELLQELIESRKTEEKEYSIVDNYLKELANQGVSIKDLRLLGDEDYENVDKLFENKEDKKQVEKYIAEFIRADIITQQPHRRESEDLVDEDNQYLVDGGIYFWRENEEDSISEETFDEIKEGEKDLQELGEEQYIQMKYVKPEEFLENLGYSADTDFNSIFGETIESTPSKKIIGDEAKMKELKYTFTEDPNTEDIVIVQFDSEEKITTEYDRLPDEALQNILESTKLARQKGQSKIEYTVKPVRKNYKNLIAKYVMPFEFLVNLCEMTQNPEFVYHVALIARNTKIIIAIHDEETISRDTVDTMTTMREYYSEVGPGDHSNYNEWDVEEREITININRTPVLKRKYANTWNYYEEFMYTRIMECTTLDEPNYTEQELEPGPLDGPFDITEEVEVTEGEGETTKTEGTEGAGKTTKTIEKHFWTLLAKHKECRWEQIKVANVTYEEENISSVEKSKQFLGLLRNTEGKCPKNCFKEVKKSDDPIALDCVEAAEFDRDGINVAYRIPNTTIYEMPLNTLSSGIQMLYAILRSNNNGYYIERDDLPLGEVIDKTITQYQDLENIKMNDNQKDRVEAEDHKKAYEIKLQAVVEHLQYLMTFPENEEYEIHDPIPGNIYDEKFRQRDKEKLDKKNRKKYINERYNVNIDDPNGMPAVTKEELITIINLYLSGQRKTNALRIVDTLMRCQDTYRVNAVFLLSFLITETGIGTANSTYINQDNNWSSYNLGHKYETPEDSIIAAASGIAGSLYFKAGKFTISDIGYTYCPNLPEYPTQGDDWVKDVTATVRAMYGEIGITVSGSYARDTLEVGDYIYPHYIQSDYQGAYGSSTISSSGCGPSSLAMIVAGLTGDSSVNPATLVANMEEYWPDWTTYYEPGVGSYNAPLYDTGFLQKYYGLSSRAVSSTSDALNALENGYPVLGGETGHILAILPVPDEYKAQGYKFYIMDSGRGHDGMYKSIAEANSVVKGSLSFIAVIEPST